MKNNHRVKIEVSNRFWFWTKYRAFCSECTWRSRWFKEEQGAMAEGWYHDDCTLFELLTNPPSGDHAAGDD